MSINHEMTYTERKILIEHLLNSDRKYHEKLTRRKLELLLELQALEVAIAKKEVEMSSMQANLKLIDIYQ